MSESPVTIPSGNELLVADLSVSGPEAVIILPGWGGTRYGPQRILLQTAQALAAHGLTTLRLDFRGRGDSTGDPVAVTLDEMIADTLSAIVWLQREHGISRFHLVGLCSGGNVAIGAASMRPDAGHVVCWSLLPFMEHKAQAAQQGTHRGKRLLQLLRKLVHPDAWRKLLRGEANVKGAMQTVVKDKEGDDAERKRKTSARDILADFARASAHLHLLYGSQDPEAGGSRAFFEAWCRKNAVPVETAMIPGAPHNFYTAKWTQQVVEQTVAWLTAR